MTDIESILQSRFGKDWETARSDKATFYKNLSQVSKKYIQDGSDEEEKPLCNCVSEEFNAL